MSSLELKVQSRGIWDDEIQDPSEISKFFPFHSICHHMSCHNGLLQVEKSIIILLFLSQGRNKENSHYYYTYDDEDMEEEEEEAQEEN